ncbi:hypothetical protein [Paraclostridium dentum]|uniref:hypothetical protein n=1 Tax=Paraclostridium dentum TaxID=2662455 RepID=UPI003F350595
MMAITKETTLREFVEQGGDVAKAIGVTKAKVTIKAKNSNIVIAGEPQVDLDLDVDNCDITIVESDDTERMERVWERLFKQQAERHAKWDAMNK